MSGRLKVGASTWAHDVRSLIDAMMALRHNEVLTYKQMAALIGKPVNGALSEYQVARDRLSRHHRIEIKTISKIGALRLDDTGIVEQLPADRTSIHRRIKRSVRRVGNVEDYSALSNTQKLEHDRHLAHMGLMREMQAPAVNRAIDERVQRGLTHVDVQQLIAVLRG